jgi:hypothetical protein
MAGTSPAMTKSYVMAKSERRYLMLSADLTTLIGIVTALLRAAWVWPVNVVAS